MPDDLPIRLATARDVPAVKAVTDAAYSRYIERIGMEPQPMEADHEANVAAGRVYVAGEPVAGLVVIEAYGDHLFLDSIAVHPGMQGQGVGRRLLDFMEERARALGLPEVRLYTHAMMWENQEIYAKRGYELVRHHTDDPYDRMHYSKRLS